MKYRNNKIRHYQKGFTLIEMLMSMFILVIIVIGASGIYVYSTRAQQKTLQLNIVAQDVQYLFDTVSRKVREGTIDYDYYGSSGWEDGDGDYIEGISLDMDGDGSEENIPKKNVLAIYNPNAGTWTIGGTTYTYKGAVIVRQDDQLSVCFCESDACSASSSATCGSASNPFVGLTTDNLEITDLEFKINPGSSPFETAYGGDDLVQPHMTMRVTLDGAGETMSVQQTVPQRFIERR